MRLHFLYELVAPLRPSAHNEYAFQFPYGVHGQQLRLSLPTRSEERCYRRIFIGQNSRGQPCCSPGAFLSERVRFHEGEEIHRLRGIEKEEEFHLAPTDGVGLITEVSR